MSIQVSKYDPPMVTVKDKKISLSLSLDDFNQGDLAISLAVEPHSPIAAVLMIHQGFDQSFLLEISEAFRLLADKAAEYDRG